MTGGKGLTFISIGSGSKVFWRVHRGCHVITFFKACLDQAVPYIYPGMRQGSDLSVMGQARGLLPRICVCNYPSIRLWKYTHVKACFFGQDSCDSGVLCFFVFDLFVVALGWSSLPQLLQCPFLDTCYYLYGFNS